MAAARMIPALTDWENAKENILPVKTGRDGTVLSRKFGTIISLSSELEKLNEQKAAFEVAVSRI
jgi:phage portal protein BeeE